MGFLKTNKASNDVSVSANFRSVQFELAGLALNTAEAAFQSSLSRHLSALSAFI